MKRTTALEKKVKVIAASWQQDATKRKKLSAADPVADALEYCASELLFEMESAIDDDDELSVAEFADLHGKARSTVRNWCAKGLITCRRKGRDWIIRRGEPCPDLVNA